MREIYSVWGKNQLPRPPMPHQPGRWEVRSSGSSGLLTKTPMRMARPRLPTQDFLMLPPFNWVTKLAQLGSWEVKKEPKTNPRVLSIMKTTRPTLLTKESPTNQPLSRSGKIQKRLSSTQSPSATILSKMILISRISRLWKTPGTSPWISDFFTFPLKKENSWDSKESEPI